MIRPKKTVVVTNPDPSAAVDRALEDVTDAAKALVATERRSRKRANIVVAFLFLLGAFGVQWVRYSDCVQANERRRDLRGVFEYLADVSVPPGASPEAFLKEIDRRLPERACRLVPTP